MHHSSTASIAANLSEFANARLILDSPDGFGPTTIDDAHAVVTAWELGLGDNSDSFEPTPEDWQDYSRYLDSDRGCLADELSPDEMDLIVGTITDREYRELEQDVIERYAMGATL